MQFLKDVLPPDCVYFFSTGEKGPSETYIISDLDTDWSGAAEHDLNVWFSYTGFAAGSERRLAKNSTHAKAFVFDMDPGKAKGYATREEVMAAFVSFVKGGKLPAPSYIVDSGYGFHVYWVLDKAIPAAQWLDVSTRFKNYLKELDAKLAVDTTRVADAAGLLRVPGTYNFKDSDNPKRCKIVLEKPNRYTVDSFSAFIPAEIAGRQARKTTGNSMSIDNGPNREHDAKAVIKGCGALRHYFANKADASEPQWRAALQLMTFTRQGRAAAHVLSTGHPGYDADDTDKKYDTILRQTEEGGIGPVTCAQFCGELGVKREVVCAGCPLAQRASSPVWRDKFADAPKVEVVTLATRKVAHTAPTGTGGGAKEELAPGLYTGCSKLEEITVRSVSDGIVTDVPKWLDESDEGNSFFVRAGALYMRKPKKKKDDEDDSAPDMSIIQVCGSAVWPVETSFATSEAGEMPGKVVAIVQGKARVISANVAALCSSPDGVKKLFTSTCGSPLCTPDPAVPTAYAAAIGRAMACGYVTQRRAVAKLGWTAEGEFVFGDTVASVAKDGAIVIDHANPQGSLENFVGQAGRFGTGGDAAAQFDVLREYGKSGSDVTKFITAAGLGAVLMEFTNANGVLLHVCGGTGVGKTSVQQFIDGLFSKPEGNRLAGVTGDTDKGTQSVMALTSSLPICIDEIRTQDPERVQTFVYSLTQGRDNVARTQDGKLRKQEGGWKTILFSSGNTSLTEMFGTVVTESGRAAAKRFLELNMRERSLQLDGRKLAEIKEATANNYGHIGRAFVAWVMKHRKWCEERVRWHIEDMAARERDDDRFVREAVAATLVAGEIMEFCDMWGVTAHDLARIAAKLRNQSADKGTLTTFDGVSYIREFVSRNGDGIAICRAVGGANVAINVAPMAVQPTRAPTVAKQLTKGNVVELIVRAAALHDFVKARGDELATVLGLMRTSGVLQCTDRGCVHMLDFYDGIPTGHNSHVTGGGLEIECYIVHIPTIGAASAKQITG